MTSSLQVSTRDNLSLLPLNALLAINARIVANPEVIRKQAPGNRSDGLRPFLTRSASSSVACGFALEGLRDAKRVYEKTTKG